MVQSSSLSLVKSFNMKVQWKQITPSPDPIHGSPLPRSSHGVSTIVDESNNNSNVRVYVCGGENVARTPLEDAQSIWCASPSEEDGTTWKWRLVNANVTSAAPVKRVGHAQCVVGTSIYMFGGRMGVELGESALNDLWELDCSQPGNETWKQVAATTSGGDEPPEKRSFHKMATDGVDNIYVFGGCGASGRLADLHKMNLTTKEWTNLGASHLLAGRGGANFLTLSDGGKLAVVAGFKGEETKDGHIFDLQSGKWDEKTMEGLDNLRPRSVCVSGNIAVDGKQTMGIIFGGEVNPSDKGHEGAGAFENDVVLLDGDSGSMVEVVKSSTDAATEWPQARGWADGCSGKGGEFYLFGGLAGDDANPLRLGDFWVCTASE